MKGSVDERGNGHERKSGINIGTKQAHLGMNVCKIGCISFVDACSLCIWLPCMKLILQ